MTATNEFLRDAKDKTRLVYGWGEEETVEPPHCGYDELANYNAAKSALVYTYAHAIPNDEALDALEELAPVVELGAGGGYWAYLLRERGIEVMALDIEVENNQWTESHWTKVEYGTAISLKHYPDHTLFLCWPPAEAELDWALRYFKGEHVVYVGEYDGGVCAPPGFFAMLERDFEQVRIIDIPRFWGNSDFMTIWRRR